MESTNKKTLLDEFKPKSGIVSHPDSAIKGKYEMDKRKSLWRRERAGLQNIVYVTEEESLKLKLTRSNKH